MRRLLRSQTARRLRHALSDEISAEKAANSDSVKRCHVVYGDRNPSPPQLRAQKAAHI